MTRINTVDPSLLIDKHLVAEYRELPRVFALVRKAIERGESPNDKRNPNKYTLGTGHVRFFYDKLKYLANRQNSLIKEMRNRNFTVNYDNVAELVDNIPEEWYNDWTPSQEDHDINIARITVRGGLRYKENNNE